MKGYGKMGKGCNTQINGPMKQKAGKVKMPVASIRKMKANPLDLPGAYDSTLNPIKEGKPKKV